MKSPPLFPRRILFPSFALALLAFVAGFGIAYQQDAAHVMELGRLAWLHLAYAQELKDDMATIDWSKNLEGLETVRAFQATANSKTIAQGGNANYLPAAAPEGTAYLFPSDWSYRETSPKGSLAPMEFTIVFHAWPGPALWGSFFFLACCAGGLGWGLLSRRVPAPNVEREPVKKPPFSPAPPAMPKPAVKPSGIALGENATYLFIDKKYVIRQATPEAAKLLRKKMEELQDGHLFDLTPDPGLVQAVERAEEVSIQKPFPDFPELSARLKPDSEGCFLILESAASLKPL